MHFPSIRTSQAYLLLPVLQLYRCSHYSSRRYTASWRWAGDYGLGIYSFLADPFLILVQRETEIARINVPEERLAILVVVGMKLV
jgi:hypothetical protein